MKKLIIILTVSLMLAAAPALAAPAYEPADLANLQKSGLGAETIGRYLAQNLDPNRKSAPVDANFLSRLGEYGGDSLASAYLDLDKATIGQTRRDYSPEVVEQLLNSNIDPKELHNILTTETARALSPAAAPAVAASSGALMPPALPPLVPPAVTPPAAPRTAETAAPVQPRLAQAPPQIITPPARPQAPGVAVPPRPEQRYQNLRPGESADPASKLPPPPRAYDIRRQQLDGPWMGVTERELADGHVVEVNSIGYASLAGQEALARPSGRQVYRYYTGNPDRPLSGADPVQEWKNREDLWLIFGDRQGGR